MGLAIVMLKLIGLGVRKCGYDLAFTLKTSHSRDLGWLLCISNMEATMGL